jgi:hypothetical protein
MLTSKWSSRIDLHPIRDYLASVLLGLADRLISQTAESTPVALASRNAPAAPPTSSAGVVSKTLTLKAQFCCAALTGALASQEEAVPTYDDEDLV